MLKVSADTDPFRIDSQRGSKGTGKLVSECHLIVHPIAYGLNTLPSPGSLPKQLAGRTR